MTSHASRPDSGTSEESADDQMESIHILLTKVRIIMAKCMIRQLGRDRDSRVGPKSGKDMQRSTSQSLGITSYKYPLKAYKNASCTTQGWDLIQILRNRTTIIHQNIK